MVLLSAHRPLEIANPGFVNDAVPVDVDALTDFSETPGAFSNLAGWAQLFGALGITANSTVIVYDDGELKFASRVRFLLAYFGVRRAFLVNGGFNALQPLIASGELFTTTPGPIMPATFGPEVKDSPIQLVDQQLVLSELGDPSVTLVDVRTPPSMTDAYCFPVSSVVATFPARGISRSSISSRLKSAIRPFSCSISQRGSVRFSSISDCVLTIASSSIATMARSHRWLRWRSSRLAIPTSRFTISALIGRTIRPIRWNPSALALEAGGSRPTPLNSLGWRHGPSGSQSFCSRRR